MNTAASAEQLALRGLLLLIVEVQNLVRDTAFAEVEEHTAKLAAACIKIEQLVESTPTVELVQLARAALDTRSSGCVHDAGARYDEHSGLSRCAICGAELKPKAVPAADAGIHV